MRIGLLTTYLVLGEETDSGIGLHFRLLADALSEAGHDVHVMFAVPEEERAKAALAKLSPRWTWEVIAPRMPRWVERQLSAPNRWAIRLLVLHLALAWSAARALKRIHRRRPLDVMETHSYNFPGLFLPWIARPPALTRVSTTLRQMLPIYTTSSRALKTMAWIESCAIRQADALVTHSERHRDLICAEEKISATRFAIVPHGVVDPGPGEHRSTDETPEAHPIRFLYVGRFETRKGIDVLLAAIPKVAAVFPSAEFVLAGAQGDGVLWSEFSRTHPTLVQHRVTAPGRVSPDELGRLYRWCDVFVAPSRYESFGLIYVEAMAHGKPVIGCRAGGIPDVVTEGESGLLAEPGDSASLVGCMIQLARNTQKRHRMGHLARAEFLHRFSIQALVGNTLACYAKTTRTPPTP